jgi:hypothetical protein
MYTFTFGMMNERCLIENTAIPGGCNHLSLGMGTHEERPALSLLPKVASALGICVVG